MRLSNKEVVSHSHISVEQLNTALRLEKSLESLRLFEGNTFYAERVDPERLSYYFWREEFEQQNNRYVVRFNNPLTNPLDEPESYTNSIYLNKSDTVRLMKERIGEIVGLPIDQFIIKKGTSNFPEMRELSLTLGSCHMWKNS